MVTSFLLLRHFVALVFRCIMNFMAIGIFSLKAYCCIRHLYLQISSNFLSFRPSSKRFVQFLGLLKVFKSFAKFTINDFLFNVPLCSIRMIGQVMVDNND